MATPTNISAVQTYIKTCADLASGAPVWVNYLGETPTEYAIVPLPGGGIVNELTDLAGNTTREFMFAFQSVESTADDIARLAASGFYEEFSEWLEEQTEAGTLPTLASGRTAVKIEALGAGFLFRQGESATGVYQIQCKLTYEQAA